MNSSTRRLKFFTKSVDIGSAQATAQYMVRDIHTECRVVILLARRLSPRNVIFK